MTVPTPPPERRLPFLRDLALILGLPLAGLGALIFWWHPWYSTPYELARPELIFTTLTGTWDRRAHGALCGAGRATITFSADRQQMLFHYARPWKDSSGVQHEEVSYEVRGVTRSTITVAARGERQRTSSGAPVVWDLVLTSANSYTWHRTDWWSMVQSGRAERCASSPPVLPGGMHVPGDTIH